MVTRLLSGFRAFAPATIFALAIFACSVKSETDSTDIGAYAPCQPNDNLECSGADGYTCSDGSTPATSSYVCILPESNLNGDFCCVSFSSTTCSAVPATSDCPTGEFEFVCTGSDDPTNGNESLNCSSGSTDGTGTSYCCTSD